MHRLCPRQVRGPQFPGGPASCPAPPLTPPPPTEASAPPDGLPPVALASAPLVPPVPPEVRPPVVPASGSRKGGFSLPEHAPYPKPKITSMAPTVDRIAFICMCTPKVPRPASGQDSAVLDPVQSDLDGLGGPVGSA
jgi:hypothetical protein